MKWQTSKRCFERLRPGDEYKILQAVILIAWRHGLSASSEQCRCGFQASESWKAAAGCPDQSGPSHADATKAQPLFFSVLLVLVPSRAKLDLRVILTLCASSLVPFLTRADHMSSYSETHVRRALNPFKFSRLFPSNQRLTTLLSNKSSSHVIENMLIWLIVCLPSLPGHLWHACRWL